MTPLLADEAETFSKPGTADVTAGDRKKLAPLIRHYGKMAHPFTACYRDQRKHGVAEDHAKRRCSVLKSLAGREEEDEIAELLEEAEDRLVAIAEVVGEETVAVLAETDPPTGDSFLAELAAEVADCSALLDFYGPMLAEAYSPPSWAVPKGSKSVTSSGKRIGGKDDPEFEKKHPRGRTGSPEGGQFVRKGASGDVVSAVQKKVGAKATGTFNEQTRRLVIEYQKKHGLQVDGVVGRQTATSMLGGGKVGVGELTGKLRRRLSKTDGGKSSSSASSSKSSSPKPISAPSEDSLPKAKSAKLAKEGWDYHDGHWYPPGHPKNKKRNRGVESDLAGDWQPGLMATEEVVDVEVRTRDDGTRTATYDRVRSALWDLERERSKTTEVRLPHGVRVTARKIAPPPERPYGLKQTEFTVTAPDGRKQKCSDASEAAEYAKDWDVQAAPKPASAAA